LWQVEEKKSGYHGRFAFGKKNGKNHVLSVQTLIADAPKDDKLCAGLIRCGLVVHMNVPNSALVEA